MMTNERKTKKVVINTEWGVFTLPQFVIDYLATKGRCIGLYGSDKMKAQMIDRDDPDLIYALENSAEIISPLKIVDIPSDVDFGIFDYDGKEEIYDKNRIWS